MLNRVKSYIMVYRPIFTIGLIILLMLAIGGIGGYGIGKVEGEHNLHLLSKRHTEEVNRLQASHNFIISRLTSRVSELADTVVTQDKELSDD